jgi:hypothetical protein
VTGNHTIVAAVTDHGLDKYSLLEKVLDQARFWEVLEREWKKSGKGKEDFQIAVKPNMAMMLRRSDVGVYTDPFLVIHLLRLLIKKGFTCLAVVESRNLYNAWFENRSVAQIAWRAGYFGVSEMPDNPNIKARRILVRGGGADAEVPVVDLSLDTRIHDFGPPTGEIDVGKSWVEADFRVNFAKMKTHFYSYYTLAIKNIYGCLPLEDKVRGYHCKRVVGPWTARLIREFPVHFSIVDGFSAADGWLGVKINSIARKPHTMIAGEDIMAVDHYGASLMGLEAERSVMWKSLKELMPAPEYEVVGKASRPDPWRNAPYLFMLAGQLIEPFANIMDFAVALATGGHDDCFPHKKTEEALYKKALFALTAPANLIFDIGFIRLRAREAKFIRIMKSHRDKLPLIAGSKFLLKRLTFLSPEDVERLIEIIEEGVDNELGFCGHYIFMGGREIPYPARLSISNLAVVELLKFVKSEGPDAFALLEELRALKPLLPDMFGDRLYPFCYG